MTRLIPRHLAVAVLAILLVTAAAVALPLGTVWAHNTLLSSDPGAGATVAVAPTQITWVFDNPAPLETLTVTLIDAAGARSELGGSTHGPEGGTVVVTPLPPLQPGPVSLRWRLVGPDGHPITGRVDFTLTAPTPTTVASTATTPPTSPAVVAPSGVMMK